MVPGHRAGHERRIVHEVPSEDERADAQIAAIGRSACYLHPSAKLWQKHMDEGKPEPEVLSFA